MQINVPEYYPKFKCTGPQCEDTCCSGWWSVSIDHDTYGKYLQNTDAELAPLFKLAVSKNTLPSADNQNNFGLMSMKPDGTCHFLQTDKFCAIQKHMGAQALSDTCRLYPRYLNRFGSQRENSLGVSCPEAARLILLNPQPMEFTTVAAEPDIDSKAFTSYQFPLQSEGDPQQISILNDFRAVIIAILQFREISLGARVMLLGFLLEEAGTVFFSEKFNHAAELLPVLESYVGMLAHPEKLETQFAQINPDIEHKLKVVSTLIAQLLADKASPRFRACLQDAIEGLEVKTGMGLSEQYKQNHAAFYRPYFADREYIFENYLVNQMITRLFPFTRGSYLDLYRELVCNLSIIQVLLVGMASKHQKLNDALVIQLFQTFARNSNHNRRHLDNLIASLHAGAQDSFVHIMWMLKDTAD